MKVEQCILRPCQMCQMYPLIHCLKSKFQNVCFPNQNVAIDKSLQCVPLNAFSFGIQSFEFCGHNMACVMFSNLHRARNEMQRLQTHQLVRVVEYFLCCGHTIWLENSCNSPVLAQFLKFNNKHCTGTLCANKKNVASLIKRCLLICAWGSMGTCLAG